MNSNTHSRTRGVLYFALGLRFAREAERSATSVRRWMPELPILIVTDVEVDQSKFDEVRSPTFDDSIKRQKMITLLSSPYDETLFLDTDTVLLGTVWELFDLLEKFDAAMTLAPGYAVTNDATNGLNRKEDGVPTAYPRWNSGVICYAQSEAWRDLVSDWLVLHRAGQPNSEDQPTLRIAAYRSVARLAPLSYAYNYRLIYPGGIRGAVKILHGRDPELSDLVDRINMNQKMRATLPRRYSTSAILFGHGKWLGSILKRFSKI